MNFSSRILNFVEPTKISGLLKTTFYSEISNNFVVGDKVFIINGNYDSNIKISNDKYSKYSDGYKVIQVEGTRITLDIDWTGDLPYNQYVYDDFINVWGSSNQTQADYLLSIKNGLEESSGGSFFFTSKFDGELGIDGVTASLYSNNILFQNGFKISQGSGIIDIDESFFSGSLEKKNRSWNGNIFIFGEDITYNYMGNIYIFRQNNAYEYRNGKWVINTKYKQPFISKLNFRKGSFNGIHNDGVYGNNLDIIEFDKAKWNGGCLINSFWNSGDLNSKSKSSDIISISKLVENTVITATDTTNLSGKGINFIEDTTIVKGNINSGNFINCNTIPTTNINPVKSLVMNRECVSDINIKNAIFTKSDITGSNIINTDLVNTDVKKSKVFDSNIANSHLYNTYVDGSVYKGDGDIKVLKVEMWSYQSDTSEENKDPENTIRGILKLFVSDEDILKLDYNNTFYLSLDKNNIINLLTDEEKIILPIETRWVVNKYKNSELSGEDIIVSIKNKEENKYKVTCTANFNGMSNPYSNRIDDGTTNHASIDIDSNIFGYWVFNGVKFSKNFNWINNVWKKNIIAVEQLNNNLDNIFKDTTIKNGDFISGLISNSEWINGDNINFSYNIISKNNGRLGMNVFGYSYSISGLTNSVFTLNQKINQIEGISQESDDVVWLSSISHNNQTDINGPLLLNSVADNGFNMTTLFNIELPINTGTYSTLNLEGNNYNSIHPIKIENSKIHGGLFKRSNLINNIIENNLFNINDINLTWDNIKRIRIVNNIISNTSNKINSGIIYKSHITGVSDIISNIVYNSVLNKSLFSGGVFKSSYWVDGTFSGGKFIDNNSRTLDILDFDDTSLVKTWHTGTFNSGDFVNSRWLSGTFNSGNFYKSNWIGGVWNNGVLGKIGINEQETKFGVDDASTNTATFSIWNNGVVNSAIVGGSSSIYWYNGIFNDGTFNSNFQNSAEGESVWYNGIFNSGKFTGFSRWKNGTFNGGRFTSKYGSDKWDSMIKTDYGWENGEFNGGIFGNGTYSGNSTWFNGEFNGGKFIGKVWNNGIFSYGDYEGSLDITDGLTNSVNMFTTDDFYGLWRSGWVTYDKASVATDKKVSNMSSRLDQKTSTATLKNVLWKSGTFSHSLGNISSSVWLSGIFSKGLFSNSYFNPFIDHSLSGSSPSFNTTSNCMWENGTFEGVEFNYSVWRNGLFNSGTLNGAIWLDGILLNGNANNIYWEKGTWRNGNWDSAPYDIDTLNNNVIEDTKTIQIINNIKNYIGTSSIFITNVFTMSSPVSIITNPTFSNTNVFESWTFSFEGTTGPEEDEVVM